MNKWLLEAQFPIGTKVKIIDSKIKDASGNIVGLVGTTGVIYDIVQYQITGLTWYIEIKIDAKPVGYEHIADADMASLLEHQIEVI